MRVLHYSLGFPPYRTGGLTKYCFDLMQTQVEQGDEVGLLWPGRMSLFGSKHTSIRKSVYKGQTTEYGIASYEIINPLPVSLDEGITEIDQYIKAGDENIYYRFLKEIKPDIIHIHTLMGLHREFIKAAKRLKIRTIFTTHDYFGLCSKVTLFYDGHTCDEMDCSKCVNCNKSALSLNKVKMMQSGIYRVLKGSFLVKKARARHRKNFFEDKKVVASDTIIADEQAAKCYQRLRSFYISILSDIDIIHFNSTIAEKIYTRYFRPKEYKVINIAHRGITDNRKIKKFDNKKLRITFLAPAKPFKGFEILIQALDELWQEGHRNFELNIYSVSGKKRSYLHEQDGFKQSDFIMIFENTDLLVAPSIWYETFGFTVLEALSYGVPVIVSENVGAKDLVQGIENCICQPTKESLKNIIEKIYTDRSLLISMNREIMELPGKLFSNSIKEIYSLYDREE